MLILGPCLLSAALLAGDTDVDKSCATSNFPSASLEDEPKCNIERVGPLSIGRFLSEYKGKKPVIVQASNNSIFKKACRREALLSSDITVGGLFFLVQSVTFILLA